VFTGIKNSLGLRTLKRLKVGKRQAIISNYHDANSVGVIYQADNESDFVLVKQFLKFLKAEYGIRNAKGLAFIDDKEVPDYFLRGINQDWFTQKDLKWNNMPFGESYNTFVEEKFDILIDLTNGESLPLRFAQKESLAGFKVGKAGSENEDLHDLLIQLKEGDTFDKYLKKVNHFLKVINQPKEKYEFA